MLDRIIGTNVFAPAGTQGQVVDHTGQGLRKHLWVFHGDLEPQSALRSAVIAINAAADRSLALFISGDVRSGLRAVDQAVPLHDMHRFALRRAKTIDGGEFIHLYADRIDHERVPVPTAYRVAGRRRHHLRRVCAVHANVAKLIVVVIYKGEVAVRLLQYLEIELDGEGKGRGHRTALVPRIGEAPVKRLLAFLLYDRRGVGGQNRVAIIADQSVVAGRSVFIAVGIFQR